MKIYRVVFTNLAAYDSVNTLKIATFFDKEKALQYYKDERKKLKEEEKELDIEDYCIDEDEKSYERYLDGRAIEDSVSIWLEDDNTYDELDINKIAKVQNEKDNDYEM